jgi:hypothetical protein
MVITIINAIKPDPLFGQQRDKLLLHSLTRQARHFALGDIRLIGDHHQPISPIPQHPQRRRNAFDQGDIPSLFRGFMVTCRRIPDRRGENAIPVQKNSRPSSILCVHAIIPSTTNTKAGSILKFQAGIPLRLGHRSQDNGLF